MSIGKNKALFLDRDGVINVEQSYVHSREQFHFREGIFELGRAAQRLGYTLFVVTNQAGIARGYYSEAEFLELTEWMVHQFAEQRIHIARVYYCPYHPVHGEAGTDMTPLIGSRSPVCYCGRGRNSSWICRRAF